MAEKTYADKYEELFPRINWRGRSKQYAKLLLEAADKFETYGFPEKARLIRFKYLEQGDRGEYDRN